MDMRALYNPREQTVSGHKFKIGQLVNYLGRERASRRKAKRFNIASRTSTNLTNA